MAASRPSAVANSASAMPGATTARLVLFEAAIDCERIHDAPYRAKKADEGRSRAHRREEAEPLFESSLSREMATSSTFSSRACMPMNDAAFCSWLRFHSFMAATKTAPRPHRRALRASADRVLPATGPTRTPARTRSSAVGAAVEHRLVDDDRPAPDRGPQQPEHDDLDDQSALRNRPRARNSRPAPEPWRTPLRP